MSGMTPTTWMDDKLVGSWPPRGLAALPIRPNFGPLFRRIRLRRAVRSPSHVSFPSSLAPYSVRVLQPSVLANVVLPAYLWRDSYHRVPRGRLFGDIVLPLDIYSRHRGANLGDCYAN